ncbi:MAG: glycosyltransferase [Burkholderiales bacterium]|nr:glycosyltransferase [Flavobacterium sp.]
MINNSPLNRTNEFAAKKIRRLISDERFELQEIKNKLPEILLLSSYPPRECGIATYTQDLIKALNNKFKDSFAIRICALASENEKHIYPEEVRHVLDTDDSNSYIKLAEDINMNAAIRMVMVQHEFGLFRNNELDFSRFLKILVKPVSLVFHTVLPRPDEFLKSNVQDLAHLAEAIVVMTHSSLDILVRDYDILEEKIMVIGHGTHLVEHTDKKILKRKYDLQGKKVLATFGLLSSGKSIETTLNALPEIIKQNPEVVFLIIGKTHPSVFKKEGENYRNRLIEQIETLGIQEQVKFINRFLTLSDLLEYLQMADVYLFTSKDPNQAVSGTFSYAISCGCPIISTPIPHACEVLKNGSGIIIDFENSGQLAIEVNRLLADDTLRSNISSNGLHKIAPNAWENSALTHALLFNKIIGKPISLHYRVPALNLNHIKKMTTSFGMIQFSIINHPDIDSGYTLDDNARALIAMCQHFELTRDEEDIKYIYTYFNFIKFCLRPNGYFLNYVDERKEFTEQNSQTNLADSNGRAIWALGYLISISELLPIDLVLKAESTLRVALENADKVYSTRAMAFIIKGVYYRNIKKHSVENVALIRQLADRMVQMFRHEAKESWLWFENYLTYANSILPEALLCAYMATGELIYKVIAKTSFDFLLAKIFTEKSIKVISNKGWLHVGEELIPEKLGGEQPIDVAYSILALSKFYEVFQENVYLKKMEIAFDWFLGNNHLNQIIYNPCTGGCFDGLEDTNVNLNQGAESTVSYLMARLTIAKYFSADQTQPPKFAINQKVHFLRPTNYFHINTL